jgi:6-phosphogluconate dehydrogenase
MRYKNVEFRPATENRSAEIVAWTYSESLDREACTTLCWIKADSEGYYMKTVGNRYVEYEDMEVLNHVAKYALRSLNVEFEFEENQHEY